MVFIPGKLIGVRGNMNPKFVAVFSAAALISALAFMLPIIPQNSQPAGFTVLSDIAAPIVETVKELGAGNKTNEQAGKFQCFMPARRQKL